MVPSLNSEGLLGGVFSPEDGSASPLHSALAFYRQATQPGRGVSFRRARHGYTGSCRPGPGGGHRSGHVLCRHQWSTQPDPWARPVARMAGLDVPVQPDSHEGGITEPVAPFLRPMLVDIRPTADSANYYFYQHATGQVIFLHYPCPADCGHRSSRNLGVFASGCASYGESWYPGCAI